MRSLDFPAASTLTRIFRIPESGSVVLVAAAASLALGACHTRTREVETGGAACETTSSAAEVPSGSVPMALGAATFDSAWTIVARSHWDTTFNGVNWRAVRDSLRPQAQAARDAGELRSVLTRMVGTLRQSHFSIIPGDAGEVSTSTAARDQSAGIGATVRDIDGAMVVTAVRNDGPAARAGVQPGFVLHTVNGCAVTAGVRQSDPRREKLSRWSATMALLRGSEGSTAQLRMGDASGRIRTFQVQRELESGKLTKVGNLPPLSADLVTEKRVVNGRTIGIIRFNIWMAVLAQDISDAVDSLRGSDAIVLDIRGNLGGMAVMASGVAGHFVDTALTLGTMYQRGGLQRYVINPQRVNSANRRVTPFAGPVAIVIDELSISTSEIFAAGMQELGRAKVFGAQSAGQALPSVAERLPNGDILYHAIANFLSPSGKPVEGAGVVPDVAIPVTRAALLKGGDPALDAAVKWAASAPPQPLRLQ